LIFIALGAGFFTSLIAENDLSVCARNSAWSTDQSASTPFLLILYRAGTLLRVYDSFAPEAAGHRSN